MNIVNIKRGGVPERVGLNVCVPYPPLRFYFKTKGTMRKAKITGCVAETVGTEMTKAAIGVGFKVGRYERYAQVGFPIEIAKTDIDRNINQKSELLTEHLMKNVRKELDHWNEGDTDTTDLENIMRLKMPFLLRKAVNMEYFTQIFK